MFISSKTAWKRLPKATKTYILATLQAKDKVVPRPNWVMVAVTDTQHPYMDEHLHSVVISVCKTARTGYIYSDDWDKIIKNN